MQARSNHSLRAGVWGLAAGLVGSLCCIGPSAAILLGLGTSSALFGLSFDRRLALGGGAALLLAGLTLALRQGPACDLRPGRRWRAPALMLATCALAFAFLGLLLPSFAARQEDAVAVAPAAQAPATDGGSMRHLTLNVEKMACPPCAASARTALRRQPAVRAFVAEEGNEEIQIDYDSKLTSAHKLARLFPLSFGVTILSDQALGSKQ